jgi:hypothetical protein
MILRFRSTLDTTVGQQFHLVPLVKTITTEQQQQRNLFTQYLYTGNIQLQL